MAHTHSLYPFQEEGVQQLLMRRSVLLADEMGLGKTIQAICAMRELFTVGVINRVVIVCPASLCRNWRKEIKLWGDGLPAVVYEGSARHGMLEGGARVLVGSYETISADLKRNTCNGSQFYDIGIDLLILDEVQRIKEPSSIRARVLSRIVAARRWAISGTPLENHPRELASVLRFLLPNEYNENDKLENLAMMMSMRDKCMVRRTKDQVKLDLPSRTVSYFPIAMTPEQQAEYDIASKQIRDKVIGAADKTTATAAIIGGLQCLRRITAVSQQGSSAKLDAIEEELEEIVTNEGKAIVFSTFSNIALPFAANRLKRFGAVLLTGSMTAAEREESHKRFTQDPSIHVMCASVKAAGVGLTWTVAQHVYHLDLWWNPQVLRQAEDRVHRIGQAHAVYVKRFVAEGTIDEGICELLTAKDEIFEYVINDQQSLPDDEPGLDRLVRLIGLKSGDIKAI